MAIVSETGRAPLAGRESHGKAHRGARTTPVPLLPPVEVIGVAKDSRYRSLLIEPPLLLYMPLSQNHEVFLSIVARAVGDPVALMPAVREAVAGLDRNLPLYDVKLLSTQVDSSLWQQRTAAGLIGHLRRALAADCRRRALQCDGLCGLATHARVRHSHGFGRQARGRARGW